MAYAADRQSDRADAPRSQSIPLDRGGQGRDARPSGDPAARRDPRQGRAPAGRPPIRPAHTLPEHRTGTIDYDRYLERSTSKFKIFSAAERRRRKRTAATAVAVAALVAIIVIWAIMSQSV